MKCHGISPSDLFIIVCSLERFHRNCHAAFNKWVNLGSPTLVASLVHCVFRLVNLTLLSLQCPKPLDIFSNFLKCISRRNVDQSPRHNSHLNISELMIKLFTKVSDIQTTLVKEISRN